MLNPLSSEGVVFVFALCALALALIILLLSYLLRMRGSPDVEKTVYECGEKPFGDARVQFNSRYYVFALVYVIFAVEIIFLMPWAVSMRLSDNMPLLLLEMVAFIGVLAVGLGYAWNKGALEWL